jgi:hypothetical protein
MTPHIAFEGTPRQAMLTSAKAIAISLALGIIGYGMLAPPELVPYASVTAASVPAKESALPAQPAAPAMIASVESQSAPAGEIGARVESPRECAPDKGITDACTYN